MSDALNAILSYDKEPVKDVYIKRFNQHFKIKGLYDDQYSEIKEQATYTTGKGNQQREEINSSELDALFIAKGVTEPDFSDPKLLKKFNVNDAAGVVKKCLLIGEIKLLQDEIFKLSGFDDGEGIEEAKN